MSCSAKWLKRKGYRPLWAGRIREYYPLSEPIRSKEMQNTARSRAEKNINYDPFSTRTIVSKLIISDSLPALSYPVEFMSTFSYCGREFDMKADVQFLRLLELALEYFGYLAVSYISVMLICLIK